MKTRARTPLALFSLLAALLSPACGSEPPPAPHPRAPFLATLAATTPSSNASAPAAPLDSPPPPVARREPHALTLHGHTLVDDYYWMRNKGSQDVLAYLAAENAYTQAMTAPMQPLIDTLYGEMLGRVQENDTTAPVRDGAWLYYARTEKGKQYPIECRRRAGAADAAEVVLVDLNEIAKTAKFVGLGAMEVSDDGNLLAYTVDTTGFRENTLHVKDLQRGIELPDRAEHVSDIAFAREPRTLFYVTEDPITKRDNQLHRHVLGQDAKKDALVYEEKDERFALELRRPRSKDFAVLTSWSHTTTEARLLDTRRPTLAPRLVAPREAGHEYYVEPGKAELYIRTNGAGRNFRLVTAPLAEPGRAGWKELVPHRADVMLEDVEAFADHVVLRERQDAKVTWRSLDPKSGASHRIAIDEPVYALGGEYGDYVDLNPDFASATFRFSYSSPTTPPSVYDEDLRTGARTLVKRNVVPRFDPARYETERLQATARDGTQVPVSIVRLRGLKADGTRPMFMQGYGAYGVPWDVRFESNLVSLLDRGVVCAVAHVRGGGDLGKAWHDGGRMAHKINTFTDFIDAAESMLKAGWAKRGSIAIEGGSAGGLLMGGVATMRPDLWRAVIARVPFVDVIGSMYDESIPLTVGEFEEWGNPKIEAQYDAMIAYSPYDNVTAKGYPPMLVETSYNDSQVMYWEPTKWVAKLRAAKTDANLLVLKTNMDPAGHHGLSGRYDHLREKAFDFAFVLTELGVR